MEDKTIKTYKEAIKEFGEGDKKYKPLGRPLKVIDKSKTSKQCRHKNCGKMKPFSEFHKNPQTADGYHDWCKECRLKLHKIWRDANRDKIQAYNRSRYRAVTVDKRKIKSERISSI